MNEHVAKLSTTKTTQAAEGMRRRAWSVAEVEAMVQAGIISQDERFEMIGGEVVPMLPKGGRHEMVKVELNRHFQKTVAETLTVAQETTLRLDEESFLEPDFCVFSRSIFPGDLRGHDVLLAVEVADSSLSYDRGRKLGVYAAYGIPEVWVINSATLVTHVYRGLGAEGYRTAFDIPPDQEIVAARAVGVGYCFARLGLSPLSAG